MNPGPGYHHGCEHKAGCQEQSRKQSEELWPFNIHSHDQEPNQKRGQIQSEEFNQGPENKEYRGLLTGVSS